MAWEARYTRNTGPVWASRVFDMAQPVVLLVWPGQFVLLDEAAEVLLATGRRHQPDLAVPAHDLAVEIEARPGVPAEGALGD